MIKKIQIILTIIIIVFTLLGGCITTIQLFNGTSISPISYYTEIFIIIILGIELIFKYKGEN